MGKSRKKRDRIEKKLKKVNENTDKRQLKKSIMKLLKFNKTKEAGLLIQKYRGRYGEL
tara:strand:- start:320 stop:493 length:174 start_codon:yes stop_codon:yes gene_type:complete